MRLALMTESKTQNITDLPAPTIEQMDAMWLALRRAEEDEAHRRSVALHCRVLASFYDEVA